MDVGQRLKIRRKELGFTQDYVAAELGVKGHKKMLVLGH